MRRIPPLVVIDLMILPLFYFVSRLFVITPSMLIIFSHLVMMGNYAYLTQRTSRALTRNARLLANVGYLSSLLLRHGRFGVFLVINGIALMFLISFLWNPEQVFSLSLLSTSDGIQTLMQAALLLSLPIWGLLFLARGENLRKRLYDLVYQRISQIFQEEPSLFPDFLKELYREWNRRQQLRLYSPSRGNASISTTSLTRELKRDLLESTSQDTASPIEANGDLRHQGDVMESSTQSTNLTHYLDQFQDFLRQTLPSIWECYSQGNVRLSVNDLFIYFVERLFSDPKWLPYLRA